MFMKAWVNRCALLVRETVVHVAMAYTSSPPDPTPYRRRLLGLLLGSLRPAVRSGASTSDRIDPAGREGGSEASLVFRW